jgi:hypothetical protein
VSSYLCVHIAHALSFYALSYSRTDFQAGLFSAALTAFIIDRSQSIQQTPAQQSAYFQKQSALLLNQISQQLSSLGAQAPISPNISLADPVVNASASDVRVNIYWFLSLVFSLFAALLATLVQGWARDYMRIFKRYSNPRKLARIRQYLHEGVKSWYMSATAEAVPGLVHISLFLFFIGLADFLLNTYGILGILTLVPITFCASLYIISTIAQVKDPRSPYRTSFSRFVWYCYSWKRRRWPKNFEQAKRQMMFPNFEDEQMRLAMEENDARKGRDERAIGWMAQNLRGDGEMESFALGIPGSFNTEWGQKVWSGATGITKYEPTHDNSVALVTAPDSSSASYESYGGLPAAASGRHVHFPLPLSPQPHLQPSTYPNPPVGLEDLSKRVRHLFETCNNRGAFVHVDDWRKRSRACVETAASFVFCMGAELRWFGEIGKLLSDLGNAEETSKFSETDLNRSFTLRWTCLSLVAIRHMLDTEQLKEYARGTIATLALQKDVDDDSLDNDDLALNNARRIDEHSATAWDCVEKIYQACGRFREPDKAVEEAEATLRHDESKLEDIQGEVDSMGPIDKGILALQSEMDKVTHGLTRQLPGVAFDTLTGPTHLMDFFDFLSDPVQPQLIYLRQRLQGLCTLGQEQQDIREVVLETIEKIRTSPRLFVGRHRLMERQLWRLQDLRGGGAFGFTLELYFLTVKKLLPSTASPSREFTTFCVGAFRAITYDWEKYKDSVGTQQIILNLVCDIAVRERGIFSNYRYPDCITELLLELLGNVVYGFANVYIEDARRELRDVKSTHGDLAFRRRAFETIERQYAPPPSQAPSDQPVYY